MGIHVVFVYPVDTGIFFFCIRRDTASRALVFVCHSCAYSNLCILCRRHNMLVETNAPKTTCRPVRDGTKPAINDFLPTCSPESEMNTK